MGVIKGDARSLDYSLYQSFQKVGVRRGGSLFYTHGNI